MFDEKCISEHALIYRIFREMHFMSNNNLKGNITHLSLIVPPKQKFCLENLHLPYKGCEIKNQLFQKLKLAFEWEPFVLEGCPSQGLKSSWGL